MAADPVRISEHVRASVSDDGLVLLDVEGGVMLAANAVGARIWRLLEEEHSLDRIARQLAIDYGVPLERADRDLCAFVASLAVRGIVTQDGQT
jgi:hypothetical protein